MASHRPPFATKATRTKAKTADPGGRAASGLRSSAGRPAIRLRLLAGSAIAMGPGKAELLEQIAQTGSIAGAARAMRMSYRRAWLLVQTMNDCFVQPLVVSAKGGASGGGAALTEDGVAVLHAYGDLSTRAADAFAPLLRAHPMRSSPRR